MRGGGKKDGVSWKRRARKKDVRTKRETTRPQGLLLSFYGHDKWRSKRRRAASGAAVGTEGGRRSSLGKKVTKEEGKEEDGDSSYTKVCGQRSDAARRTEEGCR